jgi:hypothetical protein
MDLILVLVRASPEKTDICHLVLYLLMGMRDGAVLRRCQPWSDSDAGKVPCRLCLCYWFGSFRALTNCAWPSCRCVVHMHLICFLFSYKQNGGELQVLSIHQYINFPILEEILRIEKIALLKNVLLLIWNGSLT